MSRGTSPRRPFTRRPAEKVEVAWRLVRQGLCDWGGGKPKGSSKPPRVPDRRAEEIVIEDRR